MWKMQSRGEKHSSAPNQPHQPQRSYLAAAVSAATGAAMRPVGGRQPVHGVAAAADGVIVGDDKSAAGGDVGLRGGGGGRSGGGLQFGGLLPKAAAFRRRQAVRDLERQAVPAAVESRRTRRRR